MKKALLFMAAACLSAGSMTAQIADGTVLEENVIITDLDGNTYDIFEILDQGKTVVLDLYAEWCGPCWNYHNADSGHPAGGALKDLHNIYGPEGSDEVVVIGIESDPGTPESAIDGGAGSTYGWNWLDGTPYPMANDDEVLGIFEQTYFPYIIRICPNRQIFELGQQNADGIMSDVGTCLVGGGAVNPAVLMYTGETATCGEFEVSVDMQNLGSETLENVSFEVMDGSTSLLTYDWSGSIGTFEIAEVSLGTAEITEASNITVNITSTDDDPANSSLDQAIDYAVETTNAIYVAILTDNWPQETTWEITDGDGAVVASGGPYAGQQEVLIEEEVLLGADGLGCHTFTLYDDYGDGLNGSAWGANDGNYTITDSWGNVLLEGDGSMQFSEISSPFNATSDVTGIEDVLANASIDLFPNPSATGNINLALDLISTENVTIDVYDMVGKVVFTKDLGTLPAGYTVNELNVANLNSGIYMMNVTIGTESIVSKFVLKN